MVVGSWTALVLAIWLACSGCNSEDQFKAYPVSGQVTVKGKPAEGVQVSFFGTDEVLKSATAPFPKGVTDSDGNFKLTSYDSDDGAPAGNYVVTFVWPAVVADDPEVQDQVDRFRGRYASADKSTYQVEILAGANQLEPFELK